MAHIHNLQNLKQDWASKMSKVRLIKEYRML